MEKNYLYVCKHCTRSFWTETQATTCPNCALHSGLNTLVIKKYRLKGTHTVPNLH